MRDILLLGCSEGHRPDNQGCLKIEPGFKRLVTVLDSGGGKKETHHHMHPQPVLQSLFHASSTKVHNHCTIQLASESIKSCLNWFAHRTAEEVC